MEGPVPREDSGKPRVLRHRDRVAGPWANGGGITYEVARWPEGELDFDWRLSIAEVAREGPFSAYPGIDRILVLLQGTMALVIDGTRYDVLPFAPLEFAGEAPADALLTAGPTIDFNVMTRRGRMTASIDVLEGPNLTLVPPPDGWVAALALDGDWTPDGCPESLGPWDCAIADSPLRLTGRGLVACVTLKGARQRSERGCREDQR